MPIWSFCINPFRSGIHFWILYSICTVFRTQKSLRLLHKYLKVFRNLRTGLNGLRDFGGLVPKMNQYLIFNHSNIYFGMNEPAWKVSDPWLEGGTYCKVRLVTTQKAWICTHTPVLGNITLLHIGHVQMKRRSFASHVPVLLVLQ